MRSFPALGFDPTPGSVLSAEGVAAQVRSAATAIREAADVLGGTGRQDWQGEAATAFHEGMSEELTPRVVTAADSFETAAAALEGWASSLVGFQQQAEDLEIRAVAAITAADNAAADLTAAQQSDDPLADTDGPTSRLAIANGELDSIRTEAHGLADSYVMEAGDVASCLGDAADAAPSSNWWDNFVGWLGDIEDWIQDYILPVLEDLVDILVVVVAVAAVVSFLLSNPVGWLTTAGLILAGAGIAIDAMQWAGGREDGSETLMGVLGLLTGAGLGKAVQGLASVAANSGGLSGLVPVLAGVSQGTGGAGATAVAALAFNPVGPMATWGYIVGRATEQTHDFATSGVNEVGNPVSRTVERFRNLFGGGGFATDEQHQSRERRLADEEC